MGLGPKLDLDAATAENQVFRTTRTGERKEMVALNDRLAVYIEKANQIDRLIHDALTLSPPKTTYSAFRYVSLLSRHGGIRHLTEGCLRPAVGALPGVQEQAAGGGHRGLEEPFPPAVGRQAAVRGPAEGPDQGRRADEAPEGEGASSSIHVNVGNTLAVTRPCVNFTLNLVLCLCCAVGPGLVVQGGHGRPAGRSEGQVRPGPGGQEEDGAADRGFPPGKAASASTRGRFTIFN